MQTLLRRLLSLRILLSCLCATCALVPAGRALVITVPTVTLSTAPLTANATTLTINGSGFDPTPWNNTIVFNDSAAGYVTSADANSLTVTLTNPPEGAGSLTAIVITNGQSSGAPVQIATVTPVVQFSIDSESVSQSTGHFSVTVKLLGGNLSTVASGFYDPLGLAIDSAGNLYIPNYDEVDKVTPNGVRSTFATGFDYAQGLAFDSAGNLYVANYYGGTVSKVTTDAVVSTFVSGFNQPNALAFDSTGNLYVASLGNPVNEAKVSKVTPGGVVSTLASGFDQSVTLTVDAASNIYVANLTTGVIDKVTPDGVVRVFASGMLNADGLTFDSLGNLYTDDGVGDVIKITPSGTMSTFATGFGGGNANLAFDPSGNLFVANVFGFVKKLPPTATATIVPFTVGGTAVAGTDYSGLPSSPLVFGLGQTTATITGTLPFDPGANKTLTFALGTPTGAGLGSPTVNTLTIIESPSVNPNTANLSATATSLNITGADFDPTPGNNTVTFNDGAIGTVTFSTPNLLSVSLSTPPTTAGSLTAVVTSNGVSSGAPVQVATVIPVVTSMASNVGLNATTLTISGFGFDPTAANNTVVFSDGVLGTVTSACATSLTVTLSTAPTSTGSLVAVVISDGESSGTAVQVGTVVPVVQFDVSSETINQSTGTFSVAVTFAGAAAASVSTVASGYNLNAPQGVAIDSAGNLYVSNYSTGTVIKVTPDGVYSTFASGFGAPFGLAFDTAGNLYVANPGDNGVDKVTPDGVVTPFATGFNYPQGLAFDSVGNLYVANYFGSTVSKVTPGGVVSTFASGFTGFSGYGGPIGLVCDAADNLYVSNYSAGTVSKVTPDGTVGLFASGIASPIGLAFNAAGNLYVASQDLGVEIVTPDGQVSNLPAQLGGPAGLVFDNAYNLYVVDGFDNTVSKVSASVTVPFTLGGTAVSGTDYMAVTAGPLTFGIGEQTAYITGTLLPHPGTNPTLTFTLGAPSGAVLGNAMVNTLTIVNSPVVTSSTTNLGADPTTIMIYGLGFDPTAAHNIVWLSDGAAGTVTAATSTQLTVQLSHAPAGLGALAVVVTTNGVSSGTATQIATVNGVTSITSVAYSAGTFTLNFIGAPNTTYGLQYTSNLSAPSWSDISPVTTNGNGSGQYVGTPPPGGAGFYQLVYPAQ